MTASEWEKEINPVFSHPYRYRVPISPALFLEMDYTVQKKKKSLKYVHRCGKVSEHEIVRVKCEGNRSKTHKRLKEHFLMGQNRTQRANFRGSPLFQATYNIKTRRKKIARFVCFSVLMLYVAWKRGLPRKFTRFVLFCSIKKKRSL